MSSLIAHEGDAGLGKERRGRSRSDPAPGRAARSSLTTRRSPRWKTARQLDAGAGAFSEACQEAVASMNSSMLLLNLFGALSRPHRPAQRAARRGYQSRPAQDGRRHDHARVLGIDAHRALARRRRSVRPGVVRGRRGPGRATDGGRLGHGTDCLERRPVLPGRRPRRSPQPGQRPLRNRTRRQGVLARLRPVLPVRHPDHPRHRPRSPSTSSTGF